MQDNHRPFRSLVRLLVVSGAMILTVIVVPTSAMLAGTYDASADSPPPAMLGVGPLSPVASIPDSLTERPPSVASPSRAIVATSPSTPAARASRPQLSIAIDDGRTSAAAGEKLTYAISVRNLGSDPVTGLLVTQSMPTGLELVSVDSAGTADSGKLIWRLNLKVGQTATFHTTMTVVATPADLLRLAPVACASLSATGAPIVCAAHSDQLPADTASQASKNHSDYTWWFIGAGAVVVVVGGFTVFFRLRRRAAAGS